MLFGLMTKLKLWALAVGAAVIAIGGLIMKIKSDTRQEIEAERNKQRLKSVQARREIDDEVDNLDDARLDSRSREWLRDGKR